MPTTIAQSSPFTKVVVDAIRKIYPEKLADSSFDNTGLLLEAPQKKDVNNTSVLLTVDLTTGVAQEAIDRKCSVIVAYHPIIFRALKALTLENSQQNTLLRLASEGISVYSPHTAVDAAPGGLNDWLADIITHSRSRSNPDSEDTEILPHTRSVINAVKTVKDFEDAGYGRIVQLEKPQRLATLLSRITEGLGSLSGLMIAVPQSVPAGSKGDIEIKSIGICAGSGGSLLNGLDLDLLFTGELSHHEALAAIEQGRVVVTAFHSNTERRFLSQRMQQLLQHEIRDKLEPAEQERAKVLVSQVDRDPYEIVVAGQEGW